MKKIIVLSFIFCGSIIFLTASQKKPAIQTSLQQSIAAGKIVYKKYCISCHQADGGGVPNLNPPLIKTPYVLGTKEKIIKVILKGLNENIEIEDEVFTNPMPPLNILKDKEIADVLTYVRNSFGNKASAITPADVKKVRDQK